MQLSRSSFVIALIALVALRIIVGLHFFSEGLAKVRSGRFDATPFLRQARGPAASFFHGLTGDYQGYIRLGVDADPPLRADPQLTIAIWEDWVHSLSNQQGLGESQRLELTAVLEKAKADLLDFYAANQLEIAAWLSGQQRMDGFDQDGQWQQATAQGVSSLEKQIELIGSQRRQTALAWFGAIEAIWDNLESGVNAVIPDQKFIPLLRPWSLPNLPVLWINRILPWFDLVLGILLVIGLFTRLAAVAGIGLLLGVVSTQPFWVSGVENTYYQWIEIASLWLILAIGAGRFGGLDYFLAGRRNPSALQELVT